MTVDAEQPLTFVANGITLEGAVRVPAGATRACVVLHPHPKFGGDMDNHVVTSLCRSLAGCGAATLRFNFRGTGGSGGAHDGGRGEVRDALAALVELRARCPGQPLALAGYSFGAQVAAAASSEVDLDALILVSQPLAYGELAPWPERLRVLAIAGGADPVCPADALAALEGRVERVVVVEEADHGWSGGLAELDQAVRTFLA